MFRCFRLLIGLLVLFSVAHAQEPESPSLLEKLRTVQTVEPIGTWSWEQRGGTTTLELKTTDGKLTGTMRTAGGPMGGFGGRRGGGGFGGGANVPLEIKNVVLDGDKFSFEVERGRGGFVTVTHYAGVISQDEIAGVTVSNFGGQVRESAWMAKRVAATTESLDETSPAQQTPVPAAGEPPISQTSTSVPTAALPANDNNGTAAATTANAVNPVSTVPLAEIPKPMWIPDAGEATNEPYQPRAILPGGIVMTLYPPDSPHLKRERITEVETYSLSDSVPGRINSIVNIHNPSIEVHFASPSMNTGAVVILAAGGGHRTLNVGTESADFVPYFFNYGVNTVILRNRLRSDGYEPTTDAVRDALQAIRLVRKHAETWKFDANRIGIMGFSAGAELSARAAIQFEQFDKDHGDPGDPLAGVSSRPDFVGVIYPGPSPFTENPETAVPRNTPPSFITCPGAGDRVHAKWAVDYFTAMLDAGIPNVEMHIYGNGRHPGDRGMTGGLTFRQGIPFGKWQDRYIEWFDDLGFLTAPGTETKASADTKEFVNQPPRRSGNGGRRSESAQPQPVQPDPQPTSLR